MSSMTMPNGEQQHEPPRREEDSRMPPMADPSREPQLNTAICGCRCGCVSDGDGGGEDEDADRNYRKGEEGAGEGPIRNVFTAFADFDVDEDGGFQLGGKNVNLEDPFRQIQPEPLDHVQAADSLAIHFRSNEDRTWSLSSSSFQTRHSGSSGHGMIAIGTWTGSYVFHPLLLAPQHLIPRDANLASVGDEDHVSSNWAASSYGYPGTIDSDDLVDEEEEEQY